MSPPTPDTPGGRRLRDRLATSTAARAAALALAAGIGGAAGAAVLSPPAEAPAPAAPTAISAAAPGASHAGLSAEVPPDSPVARDPEIRAAAIDASEEAAEATTAGPDDVEDPKTLAAPSQRGCVTKPVRNHSSRNGARPALLVAHYTVSQNRAGWGDVDAIVRFFDNPRAQASSTYVIDFEGHCAYIVNESLKPWTQGAFNPWSISIEFIALGTEKVWPDAALRKGALVFADTAKRWGIPIRPAVTSGCRVVQAGITDHDALACGNNHTDVKPHFPMTRFITMVKEAAAPAPQPKPQTNKLARPFEVCSRAPGARRLTCANAADLEAAIKLRLKRGHTSVTVRRR